LNLDVFIHLAQYDIKYVQMKLVLELNNDAGAQLAGRKVQLDTANYNTGANRDRGGGGFGKNNNDNNSKNWGSDNRRASAPPEVDGRQFRSGKYNHNNKDGGGRGRGGGGRGGDRRHSHQNDGSAPSGPPAGQRPSLMLKPRTKPIEEAGAPVVKSDIFGGAKPREEHARSAKDGAAAPAPAAEGDAAAAAVAEPPNKDVKTAADGQNRKTSGRGGGGRGGHDHKNHNNNTRGGGGRGGRDGGRGGRHNDGNKGRGGANKRDSKKDKFDEKKNKNKAPAAAAAAAVPPVAAAAAPADKKAEPKRVSNTFAALAFDSDSD